MRVLILGDPRFVPVQQLTEFLLGTGHDVHFATFGSGALSAPVRTHRVRHLGRLGLSLSRGAVEELARSIAPDIVHAFYLTSYGFLASRVKSAPVVVSAMGTDVYGAPELSRLMALIRRRLNMTALSGADHVHSVAQHMTDRLVAWGVPEDRITTFARGVALERFRMRVEPSQTIPPFSLLCNRKLEPVYDHATLVRGLALVAASGIPFRLKIVGDGYLRPAIEAEVRRRGLSERVSFVGQVRHSEMPGILQTTDVFLTTALSDGTSSCLLEALACGAIPVASDIPANRPWIKHGENGYLFRPTDSDALARATTAALEARGRWQEMRRLSRVLVERNGNLEAGHRRTVEIYSAISRGRERR